MTLKELIIVTVSKRKPLIKSYALVVAFGILIILSRKLWHFRAGYSFLLWNFFLAIIPLVISSFLVEMNRLQYKLKPMLLLGFFWLLFLPNAPYMLTDYKYIWIDDEDKINMNIVSLSWFILPAFLAAVISLNDIVDILLTRINKKWVPVLVIIICLLSGFGVFMGCSLRLNSWDILHRPLLVINNLLDVFIHPVKNLEAWVITFGYGMVLYLVYQVVKFISKEFIAPQE